MSKLRGYFNTLRRGDFAIAVMVRAIRCSTAGGGR
jgi:hypothetical protein